MTPSEQAPPPAATYCTVADAGFFVGLVALLNSLRLTGHEGPVAVLDTGLTEAQRDLLDGHVELHRPPAENIGNPLLYKAFPATLDLHGLVVIIDSDMVVTASLADALTAADRGGIAIFTDETQDPRWFAEWHQIFALQAPLRHGPYVNAGFVGLSTVRWPDLLRRWWDSCLRIPADATRAFGADWMNPLWDGDQDALNALLLSEVPDGAVVATPQQVADILLEVEVVDSRTLACTHRGAPARLLHHTGGPKPWHPQAWMRVQRNAYVQLLPRLLFADDVELRLRPDDVPLWLRPDPRGRAALLTLSALNRGTRAALARMPARSREVVRSVRPMLTRSRRR